MINIIASCLAYHKDNAVIRIYDIARIHSNFIAGDGRCVICDSYVRPCTLVRICDECNYGSYQGRCVICGGSGVSDAYYCKECTIMEKDRDGCPKIVNLGSAKTDLFYERKKYGFKKNG
ncbi:PHF5-like protein [Onchocerca flexuosa]|uniref:PHF5-like protein n=2 Tax=Onchocercidae TaxID=6296 RepID=A0A238BKX9_9BILA|nr:PHF5-like protein [Onchocerca flexuosa]